MLRRIFPRGSIRLRESTYPGHKNPASYGGETAVFSASKK